MVPIRCVVLAGVMALMGTGCSSMVLKQDIPVSTNPIGARILANGQPVGTTPASVSLERNRDHILTLVKEDYRQEDVVIKRQYQRDKVLMKAVASGVDAGNFFKSTSMGVQRGLGSMTAQEHTGEAYILVPPAVTVNLTPLKSPAAAPPSPGEPPRIEKPSVPASSSAEPQGEEDGSLAKDLLKAGAVGGLSAVKPIEKKWESSSSSTRSYSSPDSTTRVMKQSRTTTGVGVGVNPLGLVDVIDVLFR